MPIGLKDIIGAFYDSALGVKAYSSYATQKATSTTSGYWIAAINNYNPTQWVQDKVNTLQTRLTAARASLLDNLNNANLLNIPNLSTLTPTLIGYLANINNTNLSLIPNLSTFTPAVIGYLTNLNIANFADKFNSLDIFRKLKVDIEDEFPELDFDSTILAPLYSLFLKKQFQSQGKKLFNVTFGTVGARLVGLESLASFLNTLSSGINDWIEDHQDELNNAHISFPSGLAIPLSFGQIILPENITLPRISLLTVNGFDFEFDVDIDITFPELVLKWIKIGWPDWDVPEFSDVIIKNSENLMFARHDLYQRGYQYDPIEQLHLWRDIFGKDIVSLLAIVLALVLIDKLLGSHGMKENVLKSALKAVNLGTVNDVLKTVANTTTIINKSLEISDKVDTVTDEVDEVIETIGDVGETNPDFPSVMGNLLKITNQGMNIYDNLTVDGESILDDMSEDVDFIKEKFEKAYSPQKGVLSF